MGAAFRQHFSGCWMLIQAELSTSGMDTCHAGRKLHASGSCHAVTTPSPPAQSQRWALQVAPAPVLAQGPGQGPSLQRQPR